MKTKIVIALIAFLGWKIGAQIATNTSLGLGNSDQNNFTPAEIAEMQAKGIDPKYATVVPSITNVDGDVAYLRSQGYTDKEIKAAHLVAPPKHRATLSPTPSDLKGAYIWMDNFIGMTNANIMADIISMKAETLKFRLNDKDYDYSGHYTVMLNTPRKHANPYFGLGSPETIKILILENVGGDTFPLQNATIWEKKSNFIDAVAMDKEWIYSGTYTIQN